MDVTTLFVGRADRAEFRRALAELQATSRLRIAPNVVAAKVALDRDPAIRRIFVAPVIRNEFPERDLQQLVRQQPLAELFVVVGPWIEGETRSGRPWLGAQRLYLHQFVPWLRSGDIAARAFSPCRWRPATWSSDEAWQSAASVPWPRWTGQVGICSETPAEPSESGGCLPVRRTSLPCVRSRPGYRLLAGRRGHLRCRPRSRRLAPPDPTARPPISTSLASRPGELSTPRRMRFHVRGRGHRSAGKAISGGPFAGQLDGCDGR